MNMQHRGVYTFEFSTCLKMPFQPPCSSTWGSAHPSCFKENADFRPLCPPPLTPILLSCFWCSLVCLCQRWGLSLNISPLTLSMVLLYLFIFVSLALCAALGQGLYRQSRACPQQALSKCHELSPPISDTLSHTCPFFLMTFLMAEETEVWIQRALL